MFRVKCAVCRQVLRFSDFETHAYSHFVKQNKQKPFLINCKTCNMKFVDMLTYVNHFRIKTHGGQPDVRMLEILHETKPSTTTIFKTFVDESYIPVGNKGQRLDEADAPSRFPGYGTPVYDNDGTMPSSSTPYYDPRTPEHNGNRTPNGYVNRTPNGYVNRSPNEYVNRTPNEHVNRTPNEHVNRTPNHDGRSKIGTPGYRPQSRSDQSPSMPSTSNPKQSSRDNPPKPSASRNIGPKPSQKTYDENIGSKSPGYPRSEGVKYRTNNLNDFRNSGSKSPGFETDSDAFRDISARRESVHVDSRSTAKAMPSRNRQSTLMESNNAPVSRKEANERRERRRSNFNEKEAERRKQAEEMNKNSDNGMDRQQEQQTNPPQHAGFQSNIPPPQFNQPLSNSHQSNLFTNSVHSQPPQAVPQVPLHQPQQFAFHPNPQNGHIHYPPPQRGPLPPPPPLRGQASNFSFNPLFTQPQAVPPPQFLPQQQMPAQFQNHFHQNPPPLPQGPPPTLSSHRPRSPLQPPPPPPPPQEPSTSSSNPSTSNVPSWQEHDHVERKPTRAELNKTTERYNQRMSRGVRRTGQVERRDSSSSQNKTNESFGSSRKRNIKVEEGEDARSHKKSSSTPQMPGRRGRENRRDRRRDTSSYSGSESN